LALTWIRKGGTVAQIFPFPADLAGGRPPVAPPALPAAVRVDFTADADPDDGSRVVDVAIRSVPAPALLGRRRRGGDLVATLSLRAAATWLRDNGYSYAYGTPGVWVRGEASA
jgi:hypothetical protein